LAVLKAAGSFPADLPDTPVFAPRDYAEGFGLWGLLAGLLSVFFVRRRLSGRKRKIRQAILTLEDSPAFRMIDVMCHAAIADGRIDPREVAYIQEVARELTGLDYSEAHIRETIARADRLSRPEHLASFAKGLTLSQRHLILQAALSVVAADGQMEKRENRFIGLLLAGFRLTKDDLDQALRILASRRANAAPA
jgi:tellurite resistance protein